MRKLQKQYPYYRMTGARSDRHSDVTDFLLAFAWFMDCYAKGIPAALTAHDTPKGKEWHVWCAGHETCQSGDGNREALKGEILVSCLGFEGKYLEDNQA